MEYALEKITNIGLRFTSSNPTLRTRLTEVRAKPNHPERNKKRQCKEMRIQGVFNHKSSTRLQIVMKVYWYPSAYHIDFLRMLLVCLSWGTYFEFASA